MNPERCRAGGGWMWGGGEGRRVREVEKQKGEGQQLLQKLPTSLISKADN